VAQKEGEKEMKVLSLFSGVGGFDLGLERAGMETVFQCEWDKHATSILERHWPDTPRWTDVSTLTGAYVLQHSPIIDVVAWGSPCQDLSVAGKRAGLGGERSGLFHEGIRIIKEIREITNGQYPRFSIWENVAGALSSSNGADFGEVLYEMDEAGACFSEWRLLDAQYFGVPQRRRRVFVISVFDSATAARCPNPLLPVCEGVRRDIEAGGTERQEPTGTVAEGFGSGSFGGWTSTDTAITLSTRGHKSSNTLAVEPFTPSSFAQYEQGVGTLRSNGGDLGGGSETLVTFTKAKRAQTSTDDKTWVENKPAPTLNSFDQGDTRATTVVVGSLESRDYKGANHEGARDGKLILEPMLIDGTWMAVRRLTPVECERLMGWPDGWTDGQADTHRYKQCGNGVASPVATWIGQQLINL
jgi:DNA (cytosine-5)-methyltransferase 1